MTSVSREIRAKPSDLRFALAGLVLLVMAATAPAVSALDREPLPSGTDADYQLGGARAVPAHVGIVGRDRKARPAPGRYNVCYVNGFQTQPDEKWFWRQHWRLVLKDDGRPVTDEAWGEWLLDLRTSDRRRALARIIGRWVDGCAADGFDAVEFDNLDSWSRSHGLITRRQARTYAALLVGRAHRAGLAAGQKNWAEWDGRSAGYDFAIAEECGRWHECHAYASHYGRQVLAVEYRRVDFTHTCHGYADRWAVVLRDRELSPTGVRDWC